MPDRSCLVSPTSFAETGIDAAFGGGTGTGNRSTVGGAATGVIEDEELRLEAELSASVDSLARGEAARGCEYEKLGTPR